AAFSSFFWSIGGYNSSGVVQNNTQRYSKSANAWAAGAPIPGAPSAGWADAAFCFDSANKKIHVLNGVDGSFLYAAHQVYDPLTNTWTYAAAPNIPAAGNRSEEHTSELQSRSDLVCRLLLEKKKD